MVAVSAAAAPERRVRAPTIFAIDTAGDVCSLALACDGAIATMQSDPGQTHLEHVMPMIEQLFARVARTPGDCDAFAFASGPGSFAGLRVACTVVQGLATGCGAPVIAVGNLDALVHAAAPGGATPGTGVAVGSARALALIDARMHQAYWGAFEQGPEGWVPIGGPGICAVADLPALAETWRPDVVAARPAAIADGLAAPGRRLAGAADLAPALCDLALRRFAQGQLLAPHDAAPLYVRDRVAQTAAERREARP